MQYTVNVDMTTDKGSGDTMQWTNVTLSLCLILLSILNYFLSLAV